MARKACFPGLSRRVLARVGIYGGALAVGFALGVGLALVASGPTGRHLRDTGTRPGELGSPTQTAAGPVTAGAPSGVSDGRPAGSPQPNADEGDPVLPTSGKILVGYGWVRDPLFGDWRFHSGIDIGAPVGAAIRASLPGSVSSVTEDDVLGTCVTVEHESRGVRSLYAHCGRVLVDRGSHVEKGQVIAVVGTTGLVSTPHVHFEVIDGTSGANLDPLAYMRERKPGP